LSVNVDGWLAASPVALKQGVVGFATDVLLTDPARFAIRASNVQPDHYRHGRSPLVLERDLVVLCFSAAAGLGHSRNPPAEIADDLAPVGLEKGFVPVQLPTRQFCKGAKQPNRVPEALFRDTKFLLRILWKTGLLIEVFKLNRHA
jgi:hypothetical protein